MNDRNDGISFGCSQPCQHTNTKVPHPACLLTSAPFSVPPNPQELCISAVGGKHYTGLAHTSGSLKISSWPFAVTLLNDRGGVSSSTFIRNRRWQREGERGRAASLSWKGNETKKYDKRNKQRKKKCQDLLVFYSMNQRFYLTQAPHVISITLMIPKITKDYFSLHGLCEWW